MELDYSLPRSVMQTIVKEAHKRNIKVYYAFQLAFYCDTHGACFDPLDLSSQDLSRLLDAYKKQIVSDGMFGAQIGLDGLKAEIDAFSPTRLKTYDLAIKEMYVGSVTSTIDELRNVFPGKITYGQYFSVFDNRIISRLDELVLGLFLGKTVTPFDVENWKKATADDISSFKKQIQQETGNLDINVPINWEIYVESSKGFYGSPWIDDFCTNTMIAAHNCPQNSETTDFSMQAVPTEGALEALSTQSLFTSSSISFYSYFYTDDLVPTDVGGAFVYPNINGSIRNKPAESIVKYWFGK